MPIIAKNKLKPKVKKSYKQIPVKEISHQDLCDQVNKSLPINFRKYNFLNKIHQQHPLISKQDTALIVKAIFEVIREKIIEGYSINIRYLFNEFRLTVTDNGKHKMLRIKNRTFPSVRRANNEN